MLSRVPNLSRAAVSIADFRRLARRRLPRMVFDYIDGGAEDEITLRENCRAFEEVKLRPRSAVATPACALDTTVLGTRHALPFLLAPIGSSRMFYPRAEIVAAAEAGRAGTAYILSTLSGSRLEDVRAGSGGELWYQLYLAGGRDAALSSIARARHAGYKALVVTIDTAVAGLRERDVRNGTRELVSGSLASKLPYLAQIIAKPRWLAGFLGDGGLMKFPNVILPDGKPMPYADVGAALEQSTVCWDDFRWIREAWTGPVVVKGIHTGDDARRAIDQGAAAMVVSNHGGRQLDGVAATLRVLPEVVAAVDGRAEVLMDGGIRRGSDIVKAICLGARAVLVGRGYAWALGAAGGPGVARAIEILRTELIRTLKLMGCASLGELNESLVDVPAYWKAPMKDLRN
ncbi:MAG TPA: alpha-hydroxy acid oxidase [Vicinamibacterales bacterium]|jgi:L-lactate dehydrogenase (cytochrome)